MTYYIAAGHYGPHTGAAGFVDEGTQAIRMAHAVVAELKRRGHRAVLVPDSLDFMPAVAYINARAQAGDVGVECHMNAGSSRGVASIYKAGDAKGLSLAKSLQTWMRKSMPVWGAGVYTSLQIAAMRGWSDLGWHRGMKAGVSPLLLEIGFVTSKADADIYTHAGTFNALVENVCNGLVGREAVPAPKVAGSKVRVGGVVVTDAYVSQHKAGFTKLAAWLAKLLKAGK